MPSIKFTKSLFTLSTTRNFKPVFKYWSKEQKSVNVRVCVLTAVCLPWYKKERMTTKIGNTKGTDQTTSLPLNTHIPIWPIPTLQPSSLWGTLKLKTHLWRIHRFFFCVCTDTNVEQKCSYGTGLVWNPLSPTSHRLSDTQTFKHTHQKGETTEFLIYPKWQHGMEKGSTWRLTRTWHIHAWRLVSEAQSVWCVLMCPLCAAAAKHWRQGRQKLCVCPPVCVRVCSLKSTTSNSDWLRLAVEHSRLQRVLSEHPRDWTHTHTHTHSMQWSL